MVLHISDFSRAVSVVSILSRRTPGIGPSSNGFLFTHPNVRAGSQLPFALVKTGSQEFLRFTRQVTVLSVVRVLYATLMEEGGHQRVRRSPSAQAEIPF